MEWDVFQGWLQALKRRREAGEVSPFSWKNSESDPWWQEARAKRDAERRG